MEDRRGQALPQQRALRSHALVDRRGRAHRLGRSELAGVSQSRRAPVIDTIGVVSCRDLSPARFWSDARSLRVLGMGTALPGPPVSSAELLDVVERRFGVALSR